MSEIYFTLSNLQCQNVQTTEGGGDHPSFEQCPMFRIFLWLPLETILYQENSIFLPRKFDFFNM